MFELGSRKKYLREDLDTSSYIIIYIYIYFILSFYFTNEYFRVK